LHVSQPVGFQFKNKKYFLFFSLCEDGLRGWPVSKQDITDIFENFRNGQRKINDLLAMFQNKKSTNKE